jgi:hypothetical protein
VLQGTWHFGFGEKFDRGKLRTLPVGSVYAEPDKMTANEPVTLLLTGAGPTDTVYENPDDDPTKKHKGLV